MSGIPSPTKTFRKAIYPSIEPTRPELSAVGFELLGDIVGKVVVVTGGGTGIGAETALYFTIAGATRVAILGRRMQPLLDTKARIEIAVPGAEVYTIATEITKKDEVDAAFAKIGEAGKVDILVANAAILGHQGLIKDSSTADIMAGITANLSGNMNTVSAFLTHAAADPAVIEISSCATHLNLAHCFSSYSIAKAASARFYDFLAFENPGLAVFIVHPAASTPTCPKFADMDDVGLSAGFVVCLASGEARWLKGRYLWANWDVEELVERKGEIERGEMLKVGVLGWPFA